MSVRIRLSTAAIASLGSRLRDDGTIVENRQVGLFENGNNIQNGNFSLRICDQPAVSDNPHVVHHVIYSHRYGYMVICDADFFGWYSKYDTLRVFNIASENDPPYR